MAQSFDEAFALIQQQDQQPFNAPPLINQPNNQPASQRLPTQHPSEATSQQHASEQTSQKIPPKPARLKPRRPVFEETAILT